MNTAVITRTQLHELLWSEPITKIATRFGVRAIDIVTAASQAAIPRPPNGYWSQLVHGKACERIPLQPATEERSESVTLNYVPKPSRSGPVKQSEHVTPSIEQSPVIATNETPVRHKLVRQTAKALRGQKPDTPQGFVYPDRAMPSFTVKVRKESIERALAFLDKLAKGADEQGIEITEVKSEQNVRFAFKASDEVIPFSITERVDRREVPREIGSSHYWKDYTYHPTGRLEFHFEASYDVKARWKWADGSTQCIEDLITGILDSVPHIGSEKRRIRLEIVERNRRWEEEANLRKERERQAALEKTRRERLFKHLERWQNSRELRMFASATRAAMAQMEQTEDLASWLSWVEALAMEFDPFTDKTPPWKEWAEHVRMSKDPEMKYQLWPGHHVW